MAYESTTVAVEKSQADIRRLLKAHGCESFEFGEASIDGQTWAAVGFRNGQRLVRIKVPHKVPDPHELRKRAQRARTQERRIAIVSEAEEQEAKRIWRVIAWNLKARMEAVQEGVETFEEAFLAHLLDERTGETVYQTLSRSGKVDLGAPLLALMPGDP